MKKTKRYASAKSSISEDLSIIKKTFKERGTGILDTVPGAAGGVFFVPEISEEEAYAYVEGLAERLSEQDRLLPGGYVYLSDLLGEPELLRQVGRIIASKYLGEQIDAVMTVATKGVPIAQAVSYYLNVPFVIVRRDSKITEGSTVSVNYVSGSSERIEKMELSKRSGSLTLTVSSCRRSSHPRRLIVKDNRNSIRKEVLHLIKFVKKTVAIPEKFIHEL